MHRWQHCITKNILSEHSNEEIIRQKSRDDTSAYRLPWRFYDHADCLCTARWGCVLTYFIALLNTFNVFFSYLDDSVNILKYAGMIEINFTCNIRKLHDMIFKCLN